MALSAKCSRDEHARSGATYGKSGLSGRVWDVGGFYELRMRVLRLSTGRRDGFESVIFGAEVLRFDGRDFVGIFRRR